MDYSIDTSALLDGWRRYYPPDVFPSVWQRIDGLISDGRLSATEEVLFELAKKDDEVFEWAKQRSGMFVPIDEQIQRTVASILAEHKKLLDTRRGRSGADPFVIALAQITKATVVTGERATGSLDRRPNIPDVCAAMGIRQISLLQLFREQRWAI